MASSEGVVPSIVEKITKKATPNKTRAPRKPRGEPLHPSYFQMIAEAIIALKERDGSSQWAIAKYIEAKYKHVLPANFKKILSVQLKNLVKQHKLVKVKSSYKLSEEGKRQVAPKTAKKAVVAKPVKIKATPRKGISPRKTKKTGTKTATPKSLVPTKRTAPAHRAVPAKKRATTTRAVPAKKHGATRATPAKRRGPRKTAAKSPVAKVETAAKGAVRKVTKAVKGKSPAKSSRGRKPATKSPRGRKPAAKRVKV